MTTLFDLGQYKFYEFSTGCDTGNDYLVFQKKYIEYLRSMCKLNRWELVSVNKNHYCFSCFIRDTYQNYVYLSISDVRFSDDWYKRILIRKAKDEKDFQGGQNHFIELLNLENALNNFLFNPFN